MSSDFILAVYDISGIQNFIFSSNKLAENVGASSIVQSILENELQEILAEIDPSYKKDSWVNSNDIIILKSQDKKFEVVYIGGGNAMLIFRNKNIYFEVNKSLSKKVYDLTENGLRVTTAYMETDLTDFERDYKELFNRLNKNKNFNIRQTLPQLGIAITRLGTTDNLPAYEKDKEDYISYPAKKKREFFRKYFDNPSNNLIHEIYREKYIFTKDIDFLGQIEGENHIAVVHIDGNNMGKTLIKLIENGKSYDKTVPQLRAFSTQVKSIYRKTFKNMISTFIERYEKDKNNKFANITLKKKERKTILPIRPVILNGDDVTFISHGKLGLFFAETFLSFVSKERLNIRGENINLSASAGVAIVKTHFPFYRAYSLAEELCDSAKKKGKIIMKNNNSEMGSWLDFHIVHSGITNSLDRIREVQYNVPGMRKPKKLTSGDMEYERFNLLWRPWAINGGEDKYSWAFFKEIFRKLDKWPKNKLKKLRNVSIISDIEINNTVKEAESRGYFLPDFNGIRGYFNEEGISPYFDALDVLDFWIDLDEKREEV